MADNDALMFENLYTIIENPSRRHIVNTKTRNALMVSEARHEPMFFRGRTFKFGSKSLGGGMWQVWMTGDGKEPNV